MLIFKSMELGGGIWFLWLVFWLGFFVCLFVSVGFVGALFCWFWGLFFLFGRLGFFCVSQPVFFINVVNKNTWVLAD